MILRLAILCSVFFVCGLPADTGDQAATGGEASRWTEQAFDDLVLDVPAGWHSADDTASDEGCWVRGDPDAPDASIELLRDRTLEQLDLGLNVEYRSDGQLAGRAAEIVSGPVGTIIVSYRGIVAVQKNPDVGGALVAVVCLATPDQWETHEATFRKVLASVRLPGAKSPIVDGAPESPGLPEPPVPGAPPDSSAGHWYVHGRGDYTFRLADGWTVRHGVAQRRVDADFDTISDPSGRRAIVCARVYEQVHDTDQALSRWRKERIQGLESTEIRVVSTQVGQAPAVHIAYRVSETGQSAFRMSFVARGRRYAVTLYLPAETSLAELPKDVSAMLASIRFLYDPNAVSRWATAAVENITVPIPPQWTMRNVPASGEVLATWSTRYQGNEAMFQVTKTPDVHGAVSRVQPVWKTMGLYAGRHPATAYYGQSAGGEKNVMVVFLDYPEADGRWTVLVCQTASQDWHRFETTFHQMISGMKVAGTEPRPPRAKPTPKGQLGSYAKLDYLAGDFSYSLVSYKTGVVVRQLDTDRIEAVWSKPASYPTDPIFKTILDGNAELARTLGGAVTERVPLFDDALRIQVFDGGVMISETAFRRHWWCYHDLRSDQ